jgi:hypothetical protein
MLTGSTVTTKETPSPHKGGGAKKGKAKAKPDESRGKQTRPDMRLIQAIHQAADLQLATNYYMRRDIA